MSIKRLPHPANTAVRIQLLSDLHLEYPLPPHENQYETYTIPPLAPYLLLCGDIGLLAQLELFTSFLQRVAKDFVHVFLVLGNHEFYRTSRRSGLRAAEELERQCTGKVTVLNRTRVDFGEEACLLGCTLHSRIEREYVDRVRMCLNDFALVEGWGPDEYDNEHEADLWWLVGTAEEVRRQDERRRIVVATHHAPTFHGTSDPVFDHSPLRSAFASEVLTEVPGVHTWAFGHTHWSCDFVKDGVRVVANQGGYAIGGREGRGEGFQKGFVVEI